MLCFIVNWYDFSYRFAVVQNGVNRFVFVVWAVVSFPSREIATLALAMTRGGLCAVLALSLMSF